MKKNLVRAITAVTIGLPVLAFNINAQTVQTSNKAISPQPTAPASAQDAAIAALYSELTAEGVTLIAQKVALEKAMKNCTFTATAIAVATSAQVPETTIKNAVATVCPNSTPDQVAAMIKAPAQTSVANAISKAKNDFDVLKNINTLEATAAGPQTPAGTPRTINVISSSGASSGAGGGGGGTVASRN